MRRRISSLHTFPTKFVAPFFFLAFFLSFLFVPNSGSAFSANSVVFSLIFLVACCVFFYFWSFPLKYVAIDSDNLYVSNYLREVTIPIADIDHVTEFLLSEPRRITIHLKNPSEFGTKIVFLGTYRMFAFLSTHPIVEELERVALSKWLAT